MNNLNKDNLYLSLDEARKQVEQRWNNEKIKEQIESVLNEKYKLINVFTGDKPRAVIWRSMLSPDNGFELFYQSSNYLGCKVSPLEFLDDKFVTINEEKKALSQIRLNFEGKNKYIELTEYNKEEGKKLRDVSLKNGEKLCDFHSRLFKENYNNLIITDISDWCKNIGSAKDYYYYYLLHFVCHGVLFESFSFEEGREESFTKDIIIPAIEKIEKNFGLKPLIVRLYPENQSEGEDFYWFSYPKQINDSIIKYSKENNYQLKDFKY